jgi:hypothetical protein
MLCTSSGVKAERNRREDQVCKQHTHHFVIEELKIL